MTENSKEKLGVLRKGLKLRITEPLVRLAIRGHLSPNTLTWVGFVATALSAVLAAYGYLPPSGFILLLAGLFDLLDGMVARQSARVTRFGAALDSTLDRLSEGITLLGITVFFLRNWEEPTLAVLLAFATLVGSYLVSYVRARAEGLGVECEVGIFTRPERIVVTALGLILKQPVVALIIISLASFFTAAERLICIFRATKND